MPLKTYQFGDKQFDIDGDESLISFIDQVMEKNAELSQEVSNKPDFSEQLKLWEKAKPYFEAEKKEIDYSKNQIEVMREILTSEGHKLEESGEDVVKYLFFNVLPEYNANSKKQETIPLEEKKSSVTPIKAIGKGVTSEQMEGKLAAKRTAKPENK
ncbi:MAG: hypothetical protein AAF316_00350 [Cyanobacteria bacterium P01_A01_bin.80]